eukprot:TRINITY_DN3943_c0_g1_i3.p1 TRINITY_DN3943_c0_g1~~TRINITY_DN3943_c0_g1_i3.p1  ORF type:complete len:261 (+),score=71.57 TRINITY_DN3943_c0_g1_i3:52-834(+)
MGWARRWLTAEDSRARVTTLLTLLLHFTHPLLCVSNYLDWVRYERQQLGAVVDLYLALTITALLFYLFVASVFYMWALRWPQPLFVARSRRVYGVIVNLLFCDTPLFILEVHMLWLVGAAAKIQLVCFLCTCLSFGYSGVRSWLFVMDWFIRCTHPRQVPWGVAASLGAQPDVGCSDPDLFRTDGLPPDTFDAALPPRCRLTPAELRDAMRRFPNADPPPPSGRCPPHSATLTPEHPSATARPSPFASPPAPPSPWPAAA